MSLPISWVVAGAMPTTQVLKQTVQLAGTSASHFFGGLLQTSPPQPKPSASDNGRWGQTEPTPNSRSSSSDNRSISDRIESLRSSLAKFLNESRTRYGLPTRSSRVDSISIASNGQETPRLQGPEPLRTELENHLRSHPAIVQEINAVALQKSSASPLRLLPLSDRHESATDTWTLWVD